MIKKSDKSLKSSLGYCALLRRFLTSACQFPFTVKSLKMPDSSIWSWGKNNSRGTTVKDYPALNNTSVEDWWKVLHFKYVCLFSQFLYAFCQISILSYDIRHAALDISSSCLHCADLWWTMGAPDAICEAWILLVVMGCVAIMSLCFHLIESRVDVMFVANRVNAWQVSGVGNIIANIRNITVLISISK